VGDGALFVSSHGGLRLVVDTDTPVPGGTGKSTFLGKPSISGQDPAPQVRLAAVRALVRAGLAWAQRLSRAPLMTPTRRSPPRPGGRSLLHRSSTIEDQSAAVAARTSLRAR
jgi:hypothetical protein